MILSQSINGDREFRWQSLAACQGMAMPQNDRLAVEDFFYDTYEREPEARDATKEICRRCPVKENCLRAGIENKETGVWGGVYLKDGDIDAELN